MNKIIKQIKAIKGVVGISKLGDNGVVVIFRGEDERLSNELEPISEGTARLLFEVFKPKSLIPEELVDGEIYTSEDTIDTWIMIYRYKSFRDRRVSGFTVNYYSNIINEDKVSLEDWLEAAAPKRICRKATLAEKQKLIKAEVDYGYFHNLK